MILLSWVLALRDEVPPRRSWGQLEEVATTEWIMTQSILAGSMRGMIDGKTFSVRLAAVSSK